jgi:hypothetical protein
MNASIKTIFNGLKIIGVGLKLICMIVGPIVGVVFAMIIVPYMLSVYFSDSAAIAYSIVTIVVFVIGFAYMIRSNVNEKSN